MIQIDIRPIIEFQAGLTIMEQKTPNALKNAINAVAKSARTRMVKQAQKAYSVKSARFNKATKIKKADADNLTAVITAKGSPMELMDFTVNPKKPAYKPHPKIVKQKKEEQEDLITRLTKPIKYHRPYHHKGGKRSSATTKAKVYSSGSLKELKKGDIKAFVNYFAYEKKDKRGNPTGKTGYHFFVGQRLSKKRLPIKVLYSNSIPKMIGNEEKVFEIVTPQINSDFEREISKQMQKLFDKLNKSK